jgi:hypothetical protein
MAMCCAEMRPYQTHSSPLEAAEAGTQTVGHSPQGCRPFRVAPPMPLSVLPCKLSNPTKVWTQRWPADWQVLHTKYRRKASRESTKIYLLKRREIVHLDNAALQNQSILKKPFQNPRFCSAAFPVPARNRGRPRSQRGAIAHYPPELPTHITSLRA